MNNIFRKLVAAAFVICVSAAPVYGAESSSRPEAIGVGMGATVGAIAGGPVGFILGAAIGAKIGDEYQRKDVQVETLTSGLKHSEQRVATLQGNVAALQTTLATRTRDLQHMQAATPPDMQELLRGGIEIDLLFRTGEDVLTDDTRVRLEELARSLSAMPEIRLQLDGFADERGDEIYNQMLSERRAQHVRDLLIEYGVTEGRITVMAHGEAPAVDTSADSYALERKVSVTLFSGDTQHLAANPDS
ncbi:MAG: OmpA family protein [Woeseia sp.]